MRPSLCCSDAPKDAEAEKKEKKEVKKETEAKEG